MTYSEMEIEVEGWKAWYDGVNATEARAYPCNECGAKCHFEGFQYGENKRAFAVCENGHCEEF